MWATDFRDETCLFFFSIKDSLDSGFQAIDSRFQVLDSCFFFFSGTSILDSIFSGIPDSLSCISDFKAQYFIFHKQNFPGFRNPNSLTLRDLLGTSCLTRKASLRRRSFTPKDGTMQKLISRFSTPSWRVGKRVRNYSVCMRIQCRIISVKRLFWKKYEL